MPWAPVLCRTWSRLLFLLLLSSSDPNPHGRWFSRWQRAWLRLRRRRTLRAWTAGLESTRRRRRRWRRTRRLAWPRPIQAWPPAGRNQGGRRSAGRVARRLPGRGAGAFLTVTPLGSDQGAELPRHPAGQVDVGDEHWIPGVSLSVLGLAGDAHPRPVRQLLQHREPGPRSTTQAERSIGDADEVLAPESARLAGAIRALAAIGVMAGQHRVGIERATIDLARRSQCRCSLPLSRSEHCESTQLVPVTPICCPLRTI